MNEFEAKLHRTWVQLLVDNDYKEIAAIAIETEVSFVYSGYNPEAIAFDVSTSAYVYIKNDERIKKVMERAMQTVSQGYIYDNNDVLVEDLPFVYRVRLLEIENDWKNIVKNLIVNAQSSNQALISEKVALKKERQIYIYNEMKFASHSEVRIAQELEVRRVLFFPLPLGVRADTGNFYNDHREVDFLICQDGVWGILEVSYHPGRYEKDSEKDIWFKKSGILCIQHYSAERCYSSPREVVDEFLVVLAKHKR
ncbi:MULTISPECIES: hypothetical protein [unclassified Leptolyngbya]|uniref:hypothetical protein n=1 Tax=unclassified Leptolyngbya TaxID=2650499 RepID=UPI001689C3DD|nr:MULTISPECIES: hypothetical protein [unclassified Leptolyngbya]MBD1911448.1 hypothetical protein [Leptolyngbya sp. FACHB-8]MBD2153460.1 hypothetical protein [Leptolyngbya sp. FACHB-16]